MKRDYLLVALAVLIAFGVLFGKTVLRDEVFLFRDAAHFYYPASQHSQQAWAKSVPLRQAPLWNSNEELGRPLAGDPTSALFYPAKLLFAMPISFHLAYKFYIVGHVLLAALCAFAAGRLLGCTVVASGLASVSYAFGGAIVFQYCNVIYLISAAWLPLGLACIWRSLPDFRWRWCVGAAVVEALMILGGDPQTAYYVAILHVGLFVSVAATSRMKTARFKIGHAGLAVLLTPALAGCLAAIQIAPSYEWSRHSERRAPEAVSSGETGQRSPWSKYFSAPPVGSHRSKSYEFSIPPWRWPELLLPNFGGDLFPENHRWMTALPASGRTWAPSLYMGLLTVLLATRRMSHAKDSVDSVDRWLRLIAVMGVVGSLGWYGLGWVVDEVSVATGGKPIMWGPVGGLYWLLNIVLPIHAQFRYPAKLWTFVACATSLLAARELSTRRNPISHQQLRVLARWTSVLAGATILFAIALYWIAPWLENRISGSSGSRLFGPLVGRGVLADMTFSMVHVSILLGIGLAVVKFIRHLGIQTAVLVLLTACEIAIAHRGSIVSADSTEWETQPELVAAIKRHSIEHGIPHFRVYRALLNGTYPTAWRETSSPDRQIDGLRWDRATIAHRFGLTYDLDVLRPSAAFSSLAFESFANDTKAGLIAKNRLDMANVVYFLGRENELSEYPGLVEIAAVDLYGERIVAAYNSDALPRAWIGRTAPGNGKNDSDLVRSVVDGENVQIASYTDSEVTLLATLQANGTVVLGDSNYPGWHCWVTDSQSAETWEQPIVPVNGVLRGIELTAGTYSVAFKYQPASFRIGAAVSFVTWVAICFAVVFWRNGSTQVDLATK